MTQADLARRAGIATNTLSNLEAGRNVGFEAVLRVAIALDRVKELEGLFLPRLDSIEDIQRYERAAPSASGQKRRALIMLRQLF